MTIANHYDLDYHEKCRVGLAAGARRTTKGSNHAPPIDALTPLAVRNLLTEDPGPFVGRGGDKRKLRKQGRGAGGVGRKCLGEGGREGGSERNVVRTPGHRCGVVRPSVSAHHTSITVYLKGDMTYLQEITAERRTESRER
eukprot:3937148-Rhodomonas_salina.2